VPVIPAQAGIQMFFDVAARSVAGHPLGPRLRGDDGAIYSRLRGTFPVMQESKKLGKSSGLPLRNDSTPRMH